jgi:hypothetical protein
MKQASLGDDIEPAFDSEQGLVTYQRLHHSPGDSTP